MITFNIQAEQLGRDTKVETFVFSYDPNKGRGMCKEFGYGPNARSLHQSGFVKKWSEEWRQYCEEREGDDLLTNNY